MAGSLFSSLLVTVLLINFYCLGTSRIRALVRAASLQGVLIGLLPLLVHDHLSVGAVLLSVLAIAMKGLVIPLLLLRALRELPIKREVEPTLGFVTSLLVAAAGTALAIAIGQRLPLVTPDPHAHLAVSASLATVFTGFLLLIGRLKAVTQVVGYLLLENGVFIFGMLLVEAMPFFVEFGMLLDLVVGIFVMGILINHISRDFSTETAGRRAALEER